jgi:hypothetical protein
LLDSTGSSYMLTQIFMLFSLIAVVLVSDFYAI